MLCSFALPKTRTLADKLQIGIQKPLSEACMHKRKLSDVENTFIDWIRVHKQKEKRYEDVLFVLRYAAAIFGLLRP